MALKLPSLFYPLRLSTITIFSQCAFTIFLETSMDNPSYVIFKFREVVRFKHVQYVRFIVYCNCNCKTSMDKSLVNFDSEYSYLVNFEESVTEKPSLNPFSLKGVIRELFPQISIARVPAVRFGQSKVRST